MVGKEVADAFKVVIQLGAILAIVAAYPRRFTGLLDLRATTGFRGLRGIGLLVITTIPAVISAPAGDHYIEKYLFNDVTVAIGWPSAPCGSPSWNACGRDRRNGRRRFAHLAGGPVDRVVSVPVAVAGHVPVGVHDSGRHDVGRRSKDGHRVLLLRRRADHDCRHVLRTLQEPANLRPAICKCSPSGSSSRSSSPGGRERFRPLPRAGTPWCRSAGIGSRWRALVLVWFVVERSTSGP